MWQVRIVLEVKIHAGFQRLGYRQKMLNILLNIKYFLYWLHFEMIFWKCIIGINSTCFSFFKCGY